MGYVQEGKQRVVDRPELDAAVANLEKAINTGKFSKYGWHVLEGTLKDYIFSAENQEKKHFIEQVRTMLKLWGTGHMGKANVAAISNTCIGKADTLENIGLYISVKTTNPIRIWINEYRTKHHLPLKLDDDNNKSAKSREIDLVATKTEPILKDDSKPAQNKSQSLKPKEHEVKAEKIVSVPKVEDIQPKKDVRFVKDFKIPTKEQGSWGNVKADERILGNFVPAKNFMYEKAVEKYGRDGRAVIELVDGRATLEQIAEKTGLDPSRVLKIIMYAETGYEYKKSQAQSNAPDRFIKALDELKLDNEDKEILSRIFKSSGISVKSNEMDELWKEYTALFKGQYGALDENSRKEYGLSADMGQTEITPKLEHLGYFARFVEYKDAGATEILIGDLK